MASVHFLFASGSGHTEYVCRALCAFLEEKGHQATMTPAEAATEESVHEGDVLVMASGTWNTGGVEGQLHPYMYEFVFKKAKDADLAGKKCTNIALGDARYYYTARAGEYLRKFLKDHNGDYACDPLTIINEPYGQEEKILKWGEKLLSVLS